MLFKSTLIYHYALYERLNNESLPAVAADKQARIGCKGKDKFWYGYKKHVSVDILFARQELKFLTWIRSLRSANPALSARSLIYPSQLLSCDGYMQSGMINKVAVTPANITDAQGFAHVCPSQGTVYADKGYCLKPAQHAAKRKNVHLAAIKKNNMTGKNRDLDRWISGIRSPYERVFSKQNRRTRYAGIAKNQFAEFMNAICFNLRRLLILAPPKMARAAG